MTPVPAGSARQGGVSSGNSNVFLLRSGARSGLGRGEGFFGEHAAEQSLESWQDVRREKRARQRGGRGRGVEAPCGGARRGSVCVRVDMSLLTS